MLASLPAKDEGTVGEKSVDIDTLINRYEQSVFKSTKIINNSLSFYRKAKFFPDATLATQLFNGMPFNELPVCNIRVSPNNTIISVTDYKGML
ncbi:Hypothetical predicted protein [Drosophila guanche]|uniref:Uncharacterized protein n=1 Tax=Drosophila guanche TaxID=7266 RepID=A0A3B0JLU3_DROGU|nr:Hypothetical predicted protein [Drosophila guanche]